MAKEFREGKFEVRKKERIYDGPHSKIDAVTLSSGTHSLDLLRKEARELGAEFAAGPNWHTFLKDRGYPVFPTWRYDRENRVEYITDLRRGGTHRVIDFCGAEDNFEKASISNFEQVEAEARALVTKASDDGVIINPPNIFFDIEISTGTAKVVLGDLRELLYEPTNTGRREEVFAHNSGVLDQHMSRLRAVMGEIPSATKGSI